jgi:hypothetical protein
MVEIVCSVCPLDNQPCGLGLGVDFSCTRQCSCPVPVVKGLKLVFCVFDGSLCSGLVKDSVNDGVCCFCRDVYKWAYTCSRYDGRFSKVLRNMGFEYAP